MEKSPMLKNFAVAAFAALFLFNTPLSADEIFRIEIGKDYKNYSNTDLQRRVWELERAVWQLQQRVYQIEATKAVATVDTWVCTVTAMGTAFTGTGGSKAIATSRSIESCKSANKGDGFFCKNPTCEQ
jgi:hypothetical protein